MDARRTSKDQKMSRGSKALLWSLGLLVGLPVLFYGCLYAVALGPWLVNDVVNSGSATGASAIERAGKILGNVGGGSWRTTASNARAKWTAPDFHGDNSEYFAFNLPPQEIAAFEEAIRAEWSKDSNFRGPNEVKAMPSANNDPDWIHERLEDGVYYQRGIETIGISRKTGRVLLRRWEW